MEATNPINTEQQKGVSCHTHIPLSWSSSKKAPVPGETLHLQNLQRLHAIEALEASGLRRADPDNGVEVEMQRLETKLNLALDLLGTLLEQAVPRPESCEVDLDTKSASWTTYKAPKINSRGRLALYLHPLLAQPVIFPGVIASVEPVSTGDGYQIKCDFDPMPDDINDAYVAFVFRGHRRAVAELRLQPVSDNTDNTPA